MTIPTFKAAGTFTAGTGAITPPYPAAPNAPVSGDIAILVCESENEAISLSTAQGFVELGNQANKAAGTAATDPASRLAVYWKRCTGGDAAPTVADSGNHTTGQIYLFSGVKATGNPWNVYAEGNDGGANDLTGVIPGATTTVPDCLIFLICTSSYNGNSTTEFSGWTNADLANIVERGDNTNTAGLGGGHGSATGEKASAGAYGNTTVTLAHTSYKGAMSIALEPPASTTYYQNTGSYTAAPTATLSQGTAKNTGGFVISPSGSIARQVGKNTGGFTGSLTGTLARLIAKSAGSYSVGVTGTLAAAAVFPKTVGGFLVGPTATVNHAPIFAETVGEAIVGPVGTLSRLAGKALGVFTLSPLGNLSRTVSVTVGQHSIGPMGSLVTRTVNKGGETMRSLLRYFR